MAGKVVLITGASAGIGKAIAKEFSKHAASLVLSGRNSDNLNTVAQECISIGAKTVHTVITNFEELSEVTNLLNEATAKFKRLDVLVNNVGVLRDGLLADVTMDDFDWIFHINVKAVLYLTQLAMPYLEKTMGNIVNVSSLGSSVQKPNSLVYGMSKAALDQFTRTVALEYAPKGVRVNAVNPALVRTEICRHRDWDEKQIAEFYKRGEAGHPLGRIGEPEDIANAVVMLASDASSWITGQCLRVDGGCSLR